MKSAAEWADDRLRGYLAAEMEFANLAAFARAIQAGALRASVAEIRDYRKSIRVVPSGAAIIRINWIASRVSALIPAGAQEHDGMAHRSGIHGNRSADGTGGG